MPTEDALLKFLSNYTALEVSAFVFSAFFGGTSAVILGKFIVNYFKKEDTTNVENPNRKESNEEIDKNFSYIKEVIDLHFKHLEGLLSTLEKSLQSQGTITSTNHNSLITLISTIKENIRDFRILVEEDNKDIKKKLDEIKERLHHIQWRE